MPRPPDSSSGSNPYDGYETYVRRTVDLDALKAADVSGLVDRCTAPARDGSRGCARRQDPGPEIHRSATRISADQPGADPYADSRGDRDHRRGRFDLGLFLDGGRRRCGAADEKGTVTTSFRSRALLMYYLAEHRLLRKPVVVSVNNTSTEAHLGERYGIETSRRRRVQVHRAEDDETGAMMARKSPAATASG